MTGFGRGVGERAGVRVTIDVRAVNHRFLDLKLRGISLPPAIEEAITTRIRAAVERGAIVVSIHVGKEGAAPTRIDQAAAERAHASLASLAAHLGLPPPDLALVLAQPGVVIGGDELVGDESTYAGAALAAIELALAQLDLMRGAEGRALAADLGTRLGALVAAGGQIAVFAAAVPAQLARRLHERVRRLLDDVQVDPARLAQEVAVFADRADISEELVRLTSHLDQARTLVESHAAVGRRLDFLVQEIGRELNTIGSKSTVVEISAAIVEAKSVLEKIREQVQNVE